MYADLFRRLRRDDGPDAAALLAVADREVRVGGRCHGRWHLLRRDDLLPPQAIENKSHADIHHFAQVIAQRRDELFALMTIHDRRGSIGSAAPLSRSYEVGSTR